MKFEHLTDAEWFLPKEAKGIIFLDRKEAQEKIKESHPVLYNFMKRHEAWQRNERIPLREM